MAWGIGAQDELLLDMNAEQVSWNPHQGGLPPARWYAQHISWLNALEPPSVLWNKIIKSGNDLRFSIEVPLRCEGCEPRRSSESEKSQEKLRGILNMTIHD
jgi:hypothetical protein